MITYLISECRSQAVPLLANEPKVDAPFVCLETTIRNEPSINQACSQGSVASLNVPDAVFVGLTSAVTTIALVRLLNESCMGG